MYWFIIRKWLQFTIIFISIADTKSIKIPYFFPALYVIDSTALRYIVFDKSYLHLLLIFQLLH